MKTLSTLLVSLASLTMVLTVVDHNLATGTVQKIEDGIFKAYNEEKYLLHDQNGHALFDVVDGVKVYRYAAGKDSNYKIVTGNYYDAYQCATKKDLNRCRSGIIE